MGRVSEEIESVVERLKSGTKARPRRGKSKDRGHTAITVTGGHVEVFHVGGNLHITGNRKIAEGLPPKGKTTRERKSWRKIVSGLILARVWDLNMDESQFLTLASKTLGCDVNSLAKLNEMDLSRLYDLAEGLRLRPSKKKRSLAGTKKGSPLASCHRLKRNRSDSATYERIGGEQ